MPTMIRQAIKPPKFSTAAVDAEAVPKHSIIPDKLYFADTTLVIRPDAGPNATNTT